MSGKVIREGQGSNWKNLQGLVHFPFGNAKGTGMSANLSLNFSEIKAKLFEQQQQQEQQSGMGVARDSGGGNQGVTVHWV